MKLCIAIAFGLTAITPIASGKAVRSSTVSQRCFQLFRDADAHDRKLAMLYADRDPGNTAARLINAQETANELSAKGVTIQTMASIGCPLPSVLPSGDAIGPYSFSASGCLSAKGDKQLNDWLAEHGGPAKQIDMSPCRQQDWVGEPPVIYPPRP